MATIFRTTFSRFRISRAVLRPLSTSTSRFTANELVEDKETHTGQKWEKEDYRMARYVDKSKTVNTRHAADLILEVPPIASQSRVVSCDGGGGPLGHPKVYINLDQEGNHSCTYCGLRFYKEDHH
ncbi:unnamed protein product [Owenia fusiformis]|uniref:Zinc finger CHCC-type domain-containing protein n=1 Tax=Owenia fusiformis TaxID=6347 RepID=A0A8S4NDM3_OWEFU|nr:unnamed protein product [Owenia fusiformis]